MVRRFLELCWLSSNTQCSVLCLAPGEGSPGHLCDVRSSQPQSNLPITYYYMRMLAISEMHSCLRGGSLGVVLRVCQDVSPGL